MLVGRASEVQRIRRLLDAARSGRSDALVLHGEPGAGKTALLRCAIEECDGLTVLSACGVQSESALPFAGLHDLLRPVLGELERLPKPQAAALREALALASDDRAAGRFVAYAGVLSVLASAAASTPLLCVIDDAQWLDPESLEALLFAARRLEADAVAMLFAMRRGTAALQDTGLEELAVEPLPAAAALDLLAAAAPCEVAPELAAQLVRDTGGNPLALLETLRLLSKDQLSGGAALAGPLPVGPSAERLFARRIDALSPAARWSLLLAAAAEDPDLGALLGATRALGLPPGALEEAEAAGLVHIADACLSFTHPLARSVVYASHAPADRRRVHRALADVTTGVRRSWHLALAAFGPDESVARELESAAMAAHRRMGFASAAAALERAAHLSGDHHARARRLFMAADAARLGGQVARSLRLLAAAADANAGGQLDSKIEHARGRIELLQGRTDSARSILVGAANIAREHDPGTATTMLAEAAFAAMIGGDPDAAVAICRRADSLDPSASDRAHLIAELVGGTALFRAGQVPEGLKRVAAAAQLAARAVDQGLDYEYAILAAHALSWVGEYGEARLFLGRVAHEVRAAGALGVLPWALYVSADLETRTGRWQTARADASEAARIAQDTGNALWRTYALSCLAVLDALQGREEECRARVADADVIARELGIERPRKLADALGLLELGAGRAAHAIPYFEAVGDTRTRLAVVDLLEAYVRAHRPVPEHLHRTLEEIEAYGPLQRALVQHCRGLLAGDADVERYLAEALDAYDAAGMPFGRARAALLLGERLRRSGRRAESRSHLRAAVEAFRSLDAAAWLERAEQELRATGETVPARGPEARDRLTPQELQVARVVAQGTTNREAGAILFLSPKTIEYHLGNVYRKIGVRSRVELVGRLGDADA